MSEGGDIDSLLFLVPRTTRKLPRYREWASLSGDALTKHPPLQLGCLLGLSQIILIASLTLLFVLFCQLILFTTFKEASFGRIFTFFLCVYLRLLDWPLNCALIYWPLPLTGSMLENGVSDFESRSLTVHSAQNSQQNRNAAKSLSRPTVGPQLSNLGMEDVPLSSTNKKLGKSEAFLWEKMIKSVFLAQEGKLPLFS